MVGKLSSAQTSPIILRRLGQAAREKTTKAYICSSVCTGCLPVFQNAGEFARKLRESFAKLRERRGSGSKGWPLLHTILAEELWFSSWSCQSALGVLRLFQKKLEAGATTCTVGIILVLKDCPAKETPRKSRTRVDAKQAAAKGKRARAKAPRRSTKRVSIGFHRPAATENERFPSERPLLPLFFWGGNLRKPQRGVPCVPLNSARRCSGVS